MRVPLRYYTRYPCHDSCFLVPVEMAGTSRLFLYTQIAEMRCAYLFFLQSIKRHHTERVRADLIVGCDS